MTPTTDLLAIAHRHLIRLHAADAEPPILARGRGARVWDVEGREYIDFASGQLCSTLGHNHPALLEAIAAASDMMIHSNSWFLHETSIRLADRLAGLLPPTLGKLIFKSTGGEANELALHLAKMHTGRWEIVSFDTSYYGMTAGARSSTYSLGRRGYGPGLPGTYSIPTPDPYRCPIRHCEGECDCSCMEVGFELYDRQSEGYPAAVIVEPVIGVAGIITPTAAYFQRLLQKAHERGMLVIFDEAQTGFGRVGSMFAFETLASVPDILTLSKTFGGGVALSCTATSSRIEEDVFQKGFFHSGSHANDPLPTRVGLAVLEVIERERLADAARQKGEYLREKLWELAQEFEIIGDVRGAGLLVGVEFVRDRETKEPAYEEGTAFASACLERGLIVSIMRIPRMNSVSRMAPPLTTPQEDIDRALEIMHDALRLATQRTAKGAHR